MAGFCAECGVPLESSTGSCPSCGIVAPPNKKNGWKIVVIVLAVVIGLGVLAVGGIGYVGWRAMHGLTVGKAANVSEAELGVSVYPGAVRVEKDSMRMKALGIETESASYTTSDPESLVLSFYKAKLGPNATSTERNGKTMLSLAENAGGAKGGERIIVKPSADDSGLIEITITHTVKTP